MKRLFLAVGLLVALLGWSGKVSATPITYDIQNYSTYQNGYNLTGSITTDGTIGALTSSDILAWTVTISQGTFSQTFSGTGARASIEGIVNATASELLIPNAPTNASSTNLLELSGPSTTGGDILWDNYDSRTEYRSVLSVHSSDDTLGWYTAPTNLGRTDNTWLVAQAPLNAAPEPGSLTLFGISLLSLAGYSWRKRKYSAIA